MASVVWTSLRGGLLRCRSLLPIRSPTLLETLTTAFQPSPITTSKFSLLSAQPLGEFLKPFAVPSVLQSCGFKVKARLRRRCKDCYIVVRNQRTYVICPTHGRHKQMSLQKKEKYTWMLSHASQSRIRPW